MNRSSSNEGLRCLLAALIIAFGFVQCSKPIYNEILEQPCLIDEDNSFYGIDIDQSPTMRQVRRTLGTGVKSKIIHKRGTRMNVLFRNWDVVIDYPRYGIKVISDQVRPHHVRRRMAMFLFYDSCKCETFEGIRIGSTYYELDSLIGPCRLRQPDTYSYYGKELYRFVFCSKPWDFFLGPGYSDTATFKVQMIVKLH